MRLSNVDDVRRTGVFFLYDAEGVADDTVTTLLDGVLPHLTRLVVVVNGALQDDSRARLEALGADVVVRPNEGFDSWAYKTALETIGWDELAQTDEVVMFNFTIVGPVAPFADMFADMDARDVDYWGVSVHHGAPFDPWGLLDQPFLPLHLQSHWIAVRRSMLASAVFRAYWDDLPPIPDYAHAVARHEARFTQHFERMGFRWDVFVDTRDMLRRTFYPLNSLPVEMIRDRRSPIFKRKTLFAGIDSVIDENATGHARDLYDFLRDTGRYDVSVLDAHLARTADQRAVLETLHEWELLPDGDDAGDALRSVAIVEAGSGLAERVALAAATCDRVVVAGRRVRLQDVEVADEVEVVEVRHHALEAAGGVDEELVLLLLVDDVPDRLPEIEGDDRRAAAREALGLGTRRAAALFAADAALGMLVAPPPLHGDAFGAIARPAPEEAALVTAALDLGPASRAPVVPEAGMAWVRRSALAPLAVRVAAQSRLRLSSRGWAALVATAVHRSGTRARIVQTPRLATRSLSVMHHAMRTLVESASDGRPVSLVNLASRLRAARDAQRSD